jgi:hypothetical protein
MYHDELLLKQLLQSTSFARREVQNRSFLEAEHMEEGRPRDADKRVQPTPVVRSLV